MDEAKTVKERLAPVLPAISVAYIAREYFHKSRYWLTKKLNGSPVNGAPAKFTPEELDTLDKALKDLAARIASIDVR